MGKITGFMEYDRIEEGHVPVAERLKNFREFTIGLDPEEAHIQGARCMDCGTPFCNNGCPVNNIIPDFNDLVYRGDWERAAAVLHSTNNFPEFTARVCPAPCEEACTLAINRAPVGIKSMERAIIDRAWAEGWVRPQPPAFRTGRQVAVVGSGPAGLAAAQQLARAGHAVTLFEKNDRIGGLLRYGIPDFKLEKVLVDRRVAQLEAEGVRLRTGVLVGDWPKKIPVNNWARERIAPDALLAQFDAVLLAGGAEEPRALSIPGSDLAGIHFAMEFLAQQNRVDAGAKLRHQIRATGKRVVIVGGGDTGSDCIGTSDRQGAASVTQLQHRPQPPEHVDRLLTWPYWPHRLRTSASQEEGCAREFAIETRAFVGEHGRVSGVRTVRVQSRAGQLVEVPDSEATLPADLVLLAMGFAHPVAPVLESFGVERDARGNAKAGTARAGGYATNVPRVFAAGDMRRGQSLVVWAIREGRQAARAIDQFLMGTSDLPR